MIWRTERGVSRTIYLQTGLQPSDNDELIGVMDTPEWAALAVRCVNGTKPAPAPADPARLYSEDADATEAWDRLTDEVDRLRDRVTALTADRNRLQAQVDAAKAVHRQNLGKINICVTCHDSWPCRTTRALGAESAPAPAPGGDG